MVLTEELKDRWLSLCEAEIQSMLSGDASTDPRELRFETAALSQLLALQVLLPFSISVAAGTTVAIVKSKWIKEQPAATLQSELSARLGQGLRLGDRVRREECILVVEDLLKPYGVSREQARRVVDLLESATTENASSGKDGAI